MFRYWHILTLIRGAHICQHLHISEYHSIQLYFVVDRRICAYLKSLGLDYTNYKDCLRG
jgi:hypothetical protein